MGPLTYEWGAVVRATCILGSVSQLVQWLPSRESLLTSLMSTTTRTGNARWSSSWSQRSFGQRLSQLQRQLKNPELVVLARHQRQKKRLFQFMELCSTRRSAIIVARLAIYRPTAEWKLPTRESNLECQLHSNYAFWVNLNCMKCEFKRSYIYIDVNQRPAESLVCHLSCLL